MYYHLAQINVALLREPLDSPLLADFVAQLDPVNAVADLAPGFVWRWVGNTAEKKELLNMSVWTGVDELFSYTYRADHVEVFRNRLKWFEAPTATPLALWWIPAGHIPTPEEGYARLAWIREYGPGPFAFSFKQRFPAFLEPEAPEEGTSEIVWDGRTLVSAGNTPNSDVDAETTFHYRQEGRRVWATYEGTQLGPMGPFPPSGNRARFSFAGVVRVDDGKLAELWITWDNMAILAQLGHLPAAPNANG